MMAFRHGRSRVAVRCAYVLTLCHYSPGIERAERAAHLTWSLHPSYFLHETPIPTQPNSFSSHLTTEEDTRISQDTVGRRHKCNAVSKIPSISRRTCRARPINFLVLERISVGPRRWEGFYYRIWCPRSYAPLFLFCLGLPPAHFAPYQPYPFISALSPLVIVATAFAFVFGFPPSLPLCSTR